MTCKVHGEICEQIEALDQKIGEAEPESEGFNEEFLLFLAEHDVEGAYNEPDGATVPEREALYRVMQHYAAQKGIA